MFTLVLLKLGIALSRRLPLGTTAALAAACWRVGGLLSPRRRVVAANLRAVAAAGGDRARPGAVFASYGRYWAELLHLAARPARLAALPIRVEGAEHLAGAAARGAVCVLSAHIGNWDLLAHWLAARLPGIGYLAEELDPPALYRLFVGIRESGGARVLPAARAAAPLYRRLRRGEHAGIVADRVFGEGERTLPFLGGRRRLPSAGVELARRAGAALLPIFLLREGEGYVIKITPDLAADGDPLAAYAGRLEAEILANPGQWCVLYPLHDAAATTRDLPAGSVKGAAAR